MRAIMGSRMVTVLVLACGLAVGIAGTLAAQAVIDIHPQKLVVGTKTAVPMTGANLDVHGPGSDGGISVIAHGDLPSDETFFASFQKNAAGTYRKSMSISTHRAHDDPLTGYFVTRYNTTFTDQGVRRDEAAMQIFGGNGVAFYAPTYTAASAPGPRTVKIHGTLKVNDLDVAARIAALEARIAALEKGAVSK